MTQKELLYVEDAVNHEYNMISFLEDVCDALDDEELISFLQDEINIHTKTKEKLLKKLKEKSNE